jgi:N4-gp56 family major capsid protein
MATTDYPVGHPLAVKLWSRALFREALKECELGTFIGSDQGSMIQIKGETQKSAGDRIRMALRMQLSGRGISGDSTLEGNEEGLTTYYDDLLIDQLRHAVRTDGRVSQQRVTFDIREEARDALKDWWSDRIDTALIYQLTGYSAITDKAYTGSNSTVAPSSGNIIYADGRTTEATVCSASASGVMSLKYIDYAVERAKVISPLIRPINVNGKKKYVLILHPYQVTDLRVSTSTGQWLDIQKAALSGGQITNNPIYTDALGEYHNVIIHQSTRIPRTTNNADATATNLAGNYRALFCGAQAGIVGYGQDGGPNKMTWDEELFDYGNQLGVAAGMIWGCKKTIFNSNDFATIIINTYAAAH